MQAVQVQIAASIDSDEELQSLYNWVDEIPLSRPKRNISRDFADGVLFAEITNHFFPRLVEMHNYSGANSHTQKLYNWNTLNTKVLKKLGYQIHPQDLDDIIKAAAGAIERVLKALQYKVEEVQSGSVKVGGRPSVTPGAGGRPSAAPETYGEAPVSGRGQARPSQDLGGKGPPVAAQVQKYQREVDTELLLEKESTIVELREMVGIMSEKIKKLEQLVRIKDSKIEALGQ
eukprot:CAMPEP_0115097984 /NCGR_PEP_ID=MMETSP0227-20121206/30853_1 /TAXON_ID=89957 /ORGANISM="Polarella glacialis, Strain CCMP 1383" /LENGTH=230 /DNA_ID=CAMNT_0002492431 /DNA_START=78 /DNA_END=767 /DNA_ORIENTATION=+